MIHPVLLITLLFPQPSSAASPLPPALDILNRSAAGIVIAAVPDPLRPLPERAFDLPEEDLQGEELFVYLHEATAPQRPARGTTYTAAKAFMYSKADNSGCGGGPGIVTFYSQVCVSGSSDNGGDYKEQGDMNGDGAVDSFINAEHVWPQGYFDRRLPMVADLHHLYPTFVTPNSRRGNLKFGLVSRALYSTSAGSRLGSASFEPADAVKGNVARAMLYFVVRYYDRGIRQGMDYKSFWTDTVPLLLEWNRQDPPDAAERRRNDLIESFQGNRNPFIDYPWLAERVGEGVFRSH